MSGNRDSGEMDLGIEVTKGMLAKFALGAIGFLGTVLFARILGPTSFGGFYLLLSIVRMVDRPVNGFGNAVKKRFSEVSFDRREAAGGQVLFTVGVMALSGVGALVLREQLASYTGVENAAFLFVVLFFSLTFFYPYQQMLAATGRIGVQMWNDALRSLLTFLFQLGLLLSGLGAAGMAYGLSAATLAVMPVTHYFLRIVPAMPSRESLSSIWDYGKFSIVDSFIGRAYDRFDVFLIGFVLTPAVVGYYEVALKLTIPATFIMAAASSGIMVKVSNLHSRDEEFTGEIANALSYSSFIAIPIFFGALALPHALVETAYGQEYSRAAFLLVGLAAYRVIQTQTRIFGRTIAGIDRPDVTTLINGVTLVFNVALGYALVFRYDAVGVVAATVVAEALRYGLSVYFVRTRLPSAPTLTRFTLQQLVAGVVMYAAVAGLNTQFAASSWTTLGLVVGTGGVVYFVVLSAVSEQFRGIVSSVRRQLVALA